MAAVFVWKYGKYSVRVSPTADIPSLYRLKRPLSDVVQQTLNMMPSGFIERKESFTLARTYKPLNAIVVPLDGREPRWMINVGHHARVREVSPFVELGEAVLTHEFTIELEGSRMTPKLVRAYPGGYIPPLPWQVSAGDAPGGRSACVEFWQQHAYVYTETLVAVDTEVKKPPEWFTKSKIRRSTVTPGRGQRR
jgi:hypothetical protein